MSNYVKEHLLYFITIIIAFYAPAIYVVILVVGLTLIDTYWGIKLARFSKIEITSNRGSDFFAKLIGYFVFIGVGIIVDKEFPNIHAVWISAIIPLFSEIFSIDEKQRKLGRIGIVKKAENVYKFAKKIKNKRDDLR